MEHRDRFIRDAFARYVQSPGFNPIFNRLHRPPRLRWLLGAALLLTGAGIPLGLGLLLSALLAQRRHKAERRELIASIGRSVSILTFPVMVNRELLTRPGVTAPGLFVGSFEGDFTFDEVSELLGRMESIDEQDVSDETKRTVNGFYDAVDYTPHRRRRVPSELTGGKPLYVFDLLIISDFLPTDTLELPIVPCLAEPGDTGRIHMIPAQLVAQAGKVASAVSGLREINRRVAAIDQAVFDIAVGGDDKPSEEELAAFERELGFALPDEFRAFWCGVGCLYVAAKESVWPRAETQRVIAPYWSFLYGFVVLGIGRELPEVLDARAAIADLRAGGQTGLMPFLRRIMEADVYCFDAEGRIVRWNHEEPAAREVVDATFPELVLREFDALQDRLERKQRGEDRRGTVRLGEKKPSDPA